jgi:hypothetical protein
LTATYVGSDGRRLLRQDPIYPPELVGFGTGGHVLATHNGGYSHYNALQVQLQRRMSQGLQALVSYSLAKASDLGSDDASGPSSAVAAPSVSQIVLPQLTSSTFDIRHNLAAAISYEIPAHTGGGIRRAILNGWAADILVRASSPPPLNVTVTLDSPQIGLYRTQPDIVPNQPYWIADPTQPGGKAVNPNAFTSPAPGTVGDFPRNGLRSIYSIVQTDAALRRRFTLTERLNLDLRVEYFNVFNHPMFGAVGSMWTPYTGLGAVFGKVWPGYTTNVALGGQNPLYALGGPRSAQFTLKLHF